MDFTKSSTNGLLITTSRNPDHFLRRTSKILAFSFPNSQKMNRGSLSLKALFSYCFNNRISRLIILQNTADKTIILVNIFIIEKKVSRFAIDSTIKLTDIIKTKKHDKQSRIMIDNIEISFSKNLNNRIKEKINYFFNPIIKKTNNLHNSKRLKIDFRQESSQSIVGEVFQNFSSNVTPLFKIHLLWKCDETLE